MQQFFFFFHKEPQLLRLPVYENFCWQSSQLSSRKCEWIYYPFPRDICDDGRNNIQALVLKAGRKRDHSIHFLSPLVSATADITCLLQTLHIYYLTISVHQEVQHGLQFSVQVSQGFRQGVDQTWTSSEARGRLPSSFSLFAVVSSLQF